MKKKEEAVPPGPVSEGIPLGLKDTIVKTMRVQGVDPNQSAQLSIRRSKPPKEAEVDFRAMMDHLPPFHLSAQSAATVGDFVLRQEIGIGGMGLVESAWERSLRRDVAIKTIRPDRRSADSFELLMREAELSGALEHPNIIPIHGLGYDEDRGPVLVMKRVEGESWKALLEAPSEENDHDRLERHLEILLGVCNAVAFAHSRGVIHRDIKPTNVMVGAFGEVYLLDWGIAVKAGEVRGDASNVIVGSPAYLAPEMARGSKELTERTDVYLLGATLHEVLTGEARHMRETAAAAVFAAGNSEPCTYDESVPRELAEVCNRACHRDPESRFPDVAAFRQAIHDHLQHHGSQSVSERAMGHLERLELKLSEGADWGAVDAFFVRRHFNRGRALFQAALEVWAENEEARAGLRALMLLMFEYEVRLRNTAGAEALLDDLADVPEALMQSLVSLQASMEKQARAQHALEEIEREQRFQGSDWGRTLIGVVSGLLWFGLIVGVAQLVSRDYLELSPKMNLAIGLLWLVSTIGIRQWFRRWLAENQIFAKFMSLVILMPLFAVLNRLVALLVERDLHDVILVDYFIVSCFTGVASVLLDRALWPATLVLAGGCLLAAAYPAQALTLAGFLALFLNVYVSWLLRPTRALKPG